MQGYIKLWRKLQEKGYYKKSEYVHLWVHILLKSNHKENEFFWNNKLEKIKAGQFITGRKALSSETGINENKIERILRTLENAQQIEQQKTNKFRVITVKNWKEYQQSEQQNEQQVNNKRTTSEQQVNTNKNDKNEENEKNDKNNMQSTDCGDEVNKIFNLFYEINPTINFGNKTDRNVIESLIKRFGFEGLVAMVKQAISIQGEQYAPVVTTPFQFNKKLAEIKIYFDKKRNNNIPTL